MEPKSRYAGRDYYGVFGVAKDAPLKDIQRAYRRLALKAHPDRNGSSAESMRDFQELSRMMEILSDKDLRANYDAGGSNDADSWQDAFATFRKVTKEDIESYSTTYLGSPEEAEDVLFAYDLFQGDFEKMLEWIPLSQPGRLSIYEKIISEQIIENKMNTSESGECVAWPKWRDRAKAAAHYVHKYGGEEKEAEELLKTTVNKYLPFLPKPNQPLTLISDPPNAPLDGAKYPKMDAAKEKAEDAKGPKTKREKKSDKELAEGKGGVLGSLVVGIRERERQRHLAMVESMEQRFGKKRPRTHDLPSEEEFAKIQKRLDKRKRAKK